jgi:hypothetical protein
MKTILLTILCILPILVSAAPEKGRTTINLNGTWQFDQTVKAFPPAKFTRTIPVPGLVHLAEPKIEDYDKFFRRPDKVEIKDQHNLYNIDYTPRYSWYRKMVFIPKELDHPTDVSTKVAQELRVWRLILAHQLFRSPCLTPKRFNQPEL